MLSSAAAKGDQNQLLMIMRAQASIVYASDSMSLDLQAMADLTLEEKNARIQRIAQMIRLHMEYAYTTTFANSNNFNLAAQALNSVSKGIFMGPEGFKTVDMVIRESSLKFLDRLTHFIGQMELLGPDDMTVSVTASLGAMSALITSVTRIVDGDNLGNLPPSDVVDAVDWNYGTEVILEPDAEIPLQKDVQVGKNALDTTRFKSKDQVQMIMAVAKKLAKEVARKSVKGETSVYSPHPGCSLTVSKLSEELLARGINFSRASNEVFVQIPKGFCPSKELKDSTCKNTVSLIMTEWPTINYIYPDSSLNLSQSTRTVDIAVFVNDEEIKVKDESKGIKVTIKRSEENLPEPRNVTIEEAEEMAISLPIFYHEVLVERTAAVVNIEVNAEVEDRMIIMVDYEKLPLPENNPLIKLLTDVPLTNKGVRDLLLNDSYVQSRTGRFFVGIASLNEGAEFTKEDLSDLQSRELSQTLTSSYTFRAFTSGCYYFDEEEEEWSSDGLKVVSSNYNETVCETTHFTSFGSGFSPVPQKINFNLIYANAGFTDNLTLYLTLIFSFLSALILFIWARFKDKDDLIKMGVTPLPDNKPEDKYLYELVVFTGSVKEASCKSNIQFILSGDREETVVRNLADNKRTAFHRNGIDSFVVAVPRTLGTLEHLRIWHDNTGPDMYASWHLAFISVRDLQTQENTQFIANRWIGIDRDDGKLDITMESANLDTMGDFSHLYEASKQRNIKDNHLWFSVFYRPRRSRYTRTQRVGVCITFLYLSMVTSLMWYNYDAERTPTDGLILFGPINISTEQILVGIMSLCITYPPVLLAAFIFRRSVPRVRPKSRALVAIRKQRRQQILQSSRDAQRLLSSLPLKSGGDLNDAGDDDDDYRDSREPEDTQKLIIVKNNGNTTFMSKDAYDMNNILKDMKGNKMENEVKEKKSRELEKRKKIRQNNRQRRMLLLPWWCLILAWVLVIVTILLSFIFVWMYGITFGAQKMSKWISSFIITFAFSLLVIETIMVLIRSVIVATLCKKIHMDVDDVDYDELQPLSRNEEWLYDSPDNHEQNRKPRYVHQMEGNRETSLLEELRRKLVQEREILYVIKDVLLYFLFLAILVTMTFGNRDPSAFQMVENFRAAFVKEGDIVWDYKNKVHNTDQYWHWLKNVMLVELRAQNWYNNKPPYGLRGFLDDRANRLLGYGILRQVRIKRNNCRVPDTMKTFASDCSGERGMDLEDHRSFCAFWLDKPLFPNACDIDEFKFKTAEELQAFPMSGKLGVYSGGGFVIALKGRTDEILDRLELLHQLNWIDKQTRAVMLEFAVYNANVNLFGTATVMAEFHPGGGLRPYWRFDATRMLKGNGALDTFVFINELAFTVITVLFTMREIWRCYKQGLWKYISSYWNMAEIAILLISYSSIALYILRYLELREVLKRFEITRGNGYVRLEKAAIFDLGYQYCIAFIVFFSFLKVIKLLQFNKRMDILGFTLGRCWHDLRIFFISFGVFFFSFAVVFYRMFMLQLEEFSDIVASMQMAFSMMLGKFNFDAMAEANAWSPIIFFVFSVSISMILINIMLTIIIMAFTLVKEDLAKRANKYEILDFVVKKSKTYAKIEKEKALPKVSLPVYEFQRTPEQLLSDKAGELVESLNRLLEDDEKIDTSEKLPEAPRRKKPIISSD
ncbi:polycystin-1-like protein 2 [Oratosquilla oratoria]|uniref:polycystin-1-like protein 2 n=1 Tax=Oratosquilla oratoria TaxID=337810 RepID=UPI003F768789